MIGVVLRLWYQIGTDELRNPDVKPAVGVDVEAFKRTVRDHYRDHARDLPWRQTRDPYEILVSEVMLQQTQVPRVLRMYGPFLAAFPSIPTLARATTADVLTAWQGLGYNRRALALKHTAEKIVAEHGGLVPNTLPQLRALPGVGPATAAAVAVFAYDQPNPFIETNIRSAFLHFFFPDEASVPDRAVLPLVEATLDRCHPREWYYALMDYGAWLKKHHPNPSRRSRHHTAQTPFPGSRRQLRAAVLRSLLASANGILTLNEIREAVIAIGADATLLDSVLVGLLSEGFLQTAEGGYSVA